MKTKVFAYITLCVVICSVLINTAYIDHEINTILEDVENFDVYGIHAKEEACDMQDHFIHSSLFISLTVSHDDLSNIEDGFAELVGCLTIKDTDGAIIVKSRLINYLKHLKRLSGINFDSII